VKNHILIRCFQPVAAACLLLLAGCSTVPVTGRHGLSLVSSEQETQLGLDSFSQLKTNTPINHDPTMNATVQRVGQKIAAVAGKDLPNAQWEFVVFDSQEANAFCLPGGKVGVYSGILAVTQDDAGLATVLGHEIGHAVAHHGAERMSEQMAMDKVGTYGGQILGSALSVKDPTIIKYSGTAYGLGTQYGVALPHSRKQEAEADQIGIMYMARAGYDPAAAVAFWERFSDYNKQHGGGQTGMFAGFTSTHPLDAERIANLKKLLPQAQAEYTKAKAQ
jgi:predicted Zn-dependent protease